MGRVCRPWIRIYGALVFRPWVPIVWQRRALAMFATRPPRGVAAEPCDAGGVPAVWLRPSVSDGRRVILYLHGGGHCLGAPAMYAYLAGQVAASSRAVALLLDQRLAPEHPFPAALRDAYTAYTWLRAQHPAASVVLVGDSAGGGLALALALLLHERDEPAPAALALLSVWADLACSGDSLRRRAAADPMFIAAYVRQMVSHYTGGADPRDPQISPLYADLCGLPPLLIQVGGDEILLDDSLRLAALAQRAGVAVTLRVWPGMWHVWQLLGRIVPEGRRAIEEIGAFVGGVGAAPAAAGERAVPARAAGWWQARALVLRYGWNAMAYQILNPGMRHWFSYEGDAVVGYVVAGGYRVVAGAPICTEERLAAVALAFAADARRERLRVCYFGAQDRLLAALAGGRRSARLLLGAQPVWHPASWDAIVAGKPSLRGQIARARNKHVGVSVWPTVRATGHPALLACMGEWLAERGLPPMHFLIETDTLAHLDDRRVYVAERGGEVLGFLIASPVPLRHGWLVEQIVRSPRAPNGTSELLLDAMMRACAASGADYVTLGLSPLARHGHTDLTPAPIWTRALLWLLRAHGRRFYNFAGLEAFKRKFAPEHWELVYALSHERGTSLRTLYAITGAFGGRSPLLFMGHAVGRAALQELRWAVERLHDRA